jgi:hypothetical protein
MLLLRVAPCSRHVGGVSPCLLPPPPFSRFRRRIWWHYLFVVIPDNWQFKETGLVYITGGGNNDGPPGGTGEDELLCITLALSNRASCTVVFDVRSCL